MIARKLKNHSKMRRICAIMILAAFLPTNGILPPSVRAQEILLPAPGAMLNLSPAFTPPLLKGIKIYPDDPFRFDFILDKGDTKNKTPDDIEAESTRLIKYFLASLTTPETDLWVNLSPYEKDRIVPEAFGQTEMGRDLLAQDYILKQITASVMYPESEAGRIFWDKVRAEAQRRYGTTDVPVETFNKVWIVPEKAAVYENHNTAIVVESRLKVMLEQDYFAQQNNPTQGHRDTKTQEHKSTGAPEKILTGEPGIRDSGELAQEILREIVIPILETEVNEGQNFAPLRQVYHSLILATWYKRKLKDSVLGQAYVDQNKTAGIDIADTTDPEKIWSRYVEAFTQGVYNYIREEQDPVSGEVIPRRYFSGGAALQIETIEEHPSASNAHISPDNASIIQIRTDVAAGDASENKAAPASDGAAMPAGTAKQAVKPDGDLVPDIRMDSWQESWTNFPYYQDQIENLLAELNDDLADADLDTQEKLYQHLLSGQENPVRDKLYELSSILRENFPYMLSQADDSPNLESAIKNGLYYKIAPHVYLTPITGSFKRHLLFWADDQGIIKFAGEFMIPGQNRKNFDGLTRKKFSDHIGAAFDYQYSIKILEMEPIHYAGKLYGESFNNDTEVLFYDYPFDGKRVEMMTESCRDSWAKKMGISLLEFDRELVRESMKCYWALEKLGIGSAADSHSGNLRVSLVKNTDGKYHLKVVWIADFESMLYEKDVLINSILGRPNLGKNLFIGACLAGLSLTLGLAYSFPVTVMTMFTLSTFVSGFIMMPGICYLFYKLSANKWQLFPPRYPDKIVSPTVPQMYAEFMPELIADGIITLKETDSGTAHHLADNIDTKRLKIIAGNSYWRVLGELEAIRQTELGLTQFTVPKKEIRRMYRETKKQVKHVFEAVLRNADASDPAMLDGEKNQPPGEQPAPDGAEAQDGHQYEYKAGLIFELPEDAWPVIQSWGYIFGSQNLDSDYVVQAFDDGKLVGVYFADQTKAINHVALGAGISVDPAYQRQGIGKHLFREMLLLLKEKGFTELIVRSETSLLSPALTSSQALANTIRRIYSEIITTSYDPISLKLISQQSLDLQKWDPSAASSDDAAINPGGIDLNPSHLAIETTDTGDAVTFAIDPAMLKQIQDAPGMIPVIIGIQPLESLPQFMGVRP